MKSNEEIMKEIKIKDFELSVSVRSLFPDAQIEVDNDGQIIIYTGEYA